MANSNKSLIVAIIFASVIISSSLTFFALKAFGGVSEKDLEANIQKGIDTYVKNLQKQYDDKASGKPVEVSGDYTDDDAVIGDDDAPVTIVEFSDYQCPFCQSFYEDTLPQLKKNYIDTGKVKFIYRDYALAKHQDAYPAALFAECVRDQTDDKGYYKAHDWLFENMSGGYDKDAAIKFAQGIGADAAELQKCIDTDKFKEEIAKDMEDGSAAGFNGTPSFIINGKASEGALPYDYISQLIDAELKK